MKMSVNFTGDAHAFFLAMMTNQEFKIKEGFRVVPKVAEKPGLDVNNSEKIGFTSYSVSHYTTKRGGTTADKRKTFSMPVSLPDFSGEAVMSFVIETKDVVLFKGCEAKETEEVIPVSEEVDEVVTPVETTEAAADTVVAEKPQKVIKVLRITEAQAPVVVKMLTIIGQINFE